MANVLRVREVMRERGMTGTRLAELIGIRQASISNILNEKHFPKYETLLEIANALDVDVRELFVPTRERTRDDLLNEIERLAREAREMG